jgi:hypothetical protein
VYDRLNSCFLKTLVLLNEIENERYYFEKEFLALKLKTHLSVRAKDLVKLSNK